LKRGVQSLDVRELVYLSAGKLRELNVDRRLGLLGRIKAGINVLNLINISGEVDLIRKEVRELDRVIDGLESKWFTEQVAAHEWVEFEAPMAYTAVDSAVIFLDVAESSDEYPTGGDMRFLLHGSRHNLIGSQPASPATVEVLSELAATRSVLHPDVIASSINHFLDLVVYKARDESDEAEARLPAHSMYRFKHQIRGATMCYAVPALTDYMRLPFTAGWVRGHARVTGVVPATSEHPYTLFASPLYVQFGPTVSKRD
jgi:hypothetical protein